MVNELGLIPSQTFDPNWFLSTDAQVTAALVAIIGGFLVNRSGIRKDAAGAEPGGVTEQEAGKRRGVGKV
jgi:hypothetical protein